MKQTVLILLYVFILTSCGNKNTRTPEPDDSAETITETTNEITAESVEYEAQVNFYETVNDDLIIELNSFISILPQILVENAELLLTDANNVTLPEGYKIHLIASGDLRGDGTTSIAVFIEHPLRELTGSCILFVFIPNDGGEYDIHSQYGLSIADTLRDIVIENGIITTYINRSSDGITAGTNVSFIFTGNQLVLLKIENYYYYEETDTGFREFYYADTGIFETYSICSISVFDNLLLYTRDTAPIMNDTIPMSGFTFSDFLLGQGSPMYYEFTEIYPPMPSFSVYGVPVYQSTRLSPAEALDIVRNVIFPEYEQRPMPYSQEIMDNYALILTYELPPYFYTNGVYSVGYTGQGYPDYYLVQREGVFHQIHLYSGADSALLIVDDETGAVYLPDGATWRIRSSENMN